MSQSINTIEDNVSHATDIVRFLASVMPVEPVCRDEDHGNLLILHQVIDLLTQAQEGLEALKEEDS